MLQSKSLPHDFDLAKVIRYLESSDRNHKSSYEVWKVARDEIITEFETKSEIIFEVVYSPRVRRVDSDTKWLSEVTVLKTKIESDELTLIKRAHFIAIHEAIDAEDELWDDR